MDEWDEVLSEDADGSLHLAIEVIPASTRDEILGVNIWRRTLRVALSAPPRKGAANRAITHLLAETLEIPSDSLSMIAGARSRRKHIRIEGVEREAAMECLLAAAKEA